MQPIRPPRSTDDLRVVADWYDALARGDLDRVRAKLTADFTMRQSSRLPWGGSYFGPDGFFECYGRRISHLDTTLCIDHLFDAGDRIVQLGRLEGTVRGTGVPVSVREIDTVELRDGAVVRYTALVDVPALLTALEIPV
ncbi:MULTISPECIES: nuclear transport factor 2 family protein [Nocardia]|uniref:nuclear transport factor 2 family protein n=1 Tax=Nocardia TaxID=1817 RepID=UPI00142D3F72|nr:MULTISPECIES: nuclear transport factor 2 family protein [Nocardia]